MKGAPRYQHDCKTCVFVQRIGRLDFYVCPSDSGRSTTYILRFGDEGPDYASMTDFQNRRLHTLYRENNGMRDNAFVPYTVKDLRHLEFYFSRVVGLLLMGTIIDNA